jgi:hypothetical protein
MVETTSGLVWKGTVAEYNVIGLDPEQDTDQFELVDPNDVLSVEEELIVVQATVEAFNTITIGVAVAGSGPFNICITEAWWIE